MMVYGYLTIILLLLYLYIYVRSKGPRDGKLSKRIRGLEHEIGRLRKRARKQHIILVALLGLFLLPIANPSLSSIPAAIGNESQEAMFSTAADGDVSSESIGEDYSQKFRETSDDDIFRYPDLNTTAEFGKAYNGSSGYTRSTTTTGAGTSGTYLDTYVKDSTYMHADSGVYLGGGVVDYLTAYDWLWWCVPQHMFENMSDIKINYYGKVDADTGGAGSEKQQVEVWNWSSSSWDIIQSGNIHIYSWKTTDALGSDHYTTEENLYVFKIRFYGEVDDGIYNAYVETTLDYAALWFNLNETIKGTGYFEDFTGVSDWTVFAGNTPTSDGDVMSWTVPGDNAYDTIYTNTPSLSASARYLQVYGKSNTSTSRVMIYTYTADDQGGVGTVQGTFWLTTSWNTWQVYIDEAVECLRFYAKDTTADANLQFDYSFIAPPTEMGWQHDSSTTEGVTDGGGGSSSSDGSELTLTADSDGSTFEFAIDTTATAAYLDADYYPMIGLDFNVADSADYIKVESYDGAAWATVIANTTVGTDTLHANCRAADADIEKFRISVNPSANPRLKWFKAFSIANFTLVPNPHITNVVYVDSETGELVISTNSDQGTVKFDYDPTLSVAMATHNVWNITSSTGLDLTDSTDFSFKPEEGGSYPTYSDATRGDWTYTGTLTDMALWFRTTQTWRISAIKFIEDGTSPDILDKFVGPTDPNDDEAVTLTAVTYDAVEVYKCTVNAVVYPTGFSDVDYEMTEQTTDVLWSYEFSTLIAGYYLFAVTASDGANTYSEYIPVTVRESAIVVEEITLIGAGSDFTMMQFSARINKDCSYVIYEESANNAEAATHSGSVSEPSFNLAWTKLSTTDTNVNFTIKFTNATLTYNYTSQYQVAQTVLSITSYDWGLSETQVTLSYQTSKSGTYTVYLDDVQDSTSSFVAGSNFLNWSRPSAVDPTEIDAAMRLSDGTTTIWLNQTYSEYSLTAFSIQTLFMDLTDPSISAIFTTSWGNATGYLYEADVQKATGAEGTTLSYTKSTTAGTYSVALKIDAGGEVAWYNTTYTIATTELRVEEERIETSENYAYCRGYLNLNADYKVYEETVEIATGSVTAGSIEIRWTKASNSVANVTVLFTSGGQEYPVYGSYQVAAQTSFAVEEWDIDLHLGEHSYVSFEVRTTFGNATIQAYDNNTLMKTVTESEGGIISWFWLEGSGLHNITLNITSGATTFTRVMPVDVPDWASGSLVVRFDLMTFQDNYTLLELESTWRNCTYYIYLNDSLISTAAVDPTTLNITRPISIGEYNLTIYADGGTQTYTISNIRYVVTEEGVEYDYSNVHYGGVVAEGDEYTVENWDPVYNENPPGFFVTTDALIILAIAVVVGGIMAIVVVKTQLLKERERTSRSLQQ